MSRPPFHLVMIGPPGSGKGTQAHFLAEEFKMPYLSAGELIRKKAQEKSKEGQKVKEIHDQGALIPHGLTKKLFEKALKDIPTGNPVIFDGYPRTETQYFDFLDILKKRGLKNKRVFVLKVKNSSVYQRLGGRRFCPSCEKIYEPPESLRQKKCSCGGKLQRRPDDTRGAISKRLKNYSQETEQAILRFKKEGELIEINGELAIKRVSQQVKERIREAS